MRSVEKMGRADQRAQRRTRSTHSTASTLGRPQRRKTINFMSHNALFREDGAKSGGRRCAPRTGVTTFSLRPSGNALLQCRFAKSFFIGQVFSDKLLGARSGRRQISSSNHTRSSESRSRNLRLQSRGAHPECHRFPSFISSHSRSTPLEREAPNQVSPPTCPYFQATAGYALWNDEYPATVATTAGSGGGHAKGILGLSATQGFYLVHNAPKFPDPPSTSKPFRPFRSVPVGNIPPKCQDSLLYLVHSCALTPGPAVAR